MPANSKPPFNHADMRWLTATQVQGWVLAHAKAGHGLAGSCFWSLAAEAFPDYDGYKVHLQQPGISGNAAPGRPAMPQKQALSRGAERPGAAGSLPALDEQSSSRQAGGSPSSRDAAAERASQIDAGPARPDETGAAAPAAEQGVRLGLPRVSSATQDACEAASGMFEGSGPQAAQEAWRLEALTAGFIAQHAQAMGALNRPEGSGHRGCTAM